MRNLLFMLLAVIITSCGDDYDDSAIWDKINSFEERLQDLEKKVDDINSKTLSLQELLKSIQDRKYVESINATTDGYTILFSDGQSISIKNGKNGVNAPVISMKKDTDGVYYWTQTIDGKTSWLLDPITNSKIAASSVAPIIKVDREGYWIVSYNNGASYEQIKDPEGKPVKALGKDGDSMFKSVTIEGNFLIMVLVSGEEITLPIETAPFVSYDNAVDLGLSVKWAKFNVGATSEDLIGDRFAWGEVEQKSGDYTLENYLYYDSKTSQYTIKHTEISGTKYDVARQKWGGRWRMPTKEEMDELQKKCKEVSDFRSVTYTAENGNSVKFVYNRNYNSSNKAPAYWTGSRTKDGNTAYCLQHKVGSLPTVSNTFNFYLYIDAGVRPVLDK